MDFSAGLGAVFGTGAGFEAEGLAAGLERGLAIGFGAE